MKPILLFFHVTPIKKHMVETAEFIQSVKNDGVLEVMDVVTNGDNDMHEALAKHWTHRSILIIGQDNVPTKKMLIELINCKHNVCSNPCLMYEASTALKGTYLNQIDNGRLLSPKETPEFVTNGGTGFSKISKDAQLEHDLPFLHWQSLDSKMHTIFKRWHLHYPLHKHNKTDMEASHFKNINTMLP